MRLIRFTTAAAVASLLIAGAGTSMMGFAAAQTIPYIQTFESFQNAGDLTNAVTGWTQGGTEGEVGISATEFMEGAKAAYAGTTTMESSLKLSIDDTKDYSNVWCRIVVKPTLYDNDTVPGDPGADCFAAFVINSDLNVRAYSNDEWVVVGTVSAANGSDWRTLIVHADYSGSKWDIYESTPDANGTSWDVYQSKAGQRINAQPIAGNASYTPLQRRMAGLEITGAKTIIDAIALAEDHQTPAQSRSNVVVAALSLTADQVTQVGLPARAYTADEDTLDQLIGDDLLTWLGNGDTLTLRKDAGTAIDHHYSVSGSDWDTALANGLTTTAAEILPGQGVWITKHTTGGPAVFFADYDALRSPNKSVFADSLASAEPDLKGFNPLAWNSDVPSQPAHVGHFGFRNKAAVGDFIYMRVNGQMKRLFRSTDGKWIGDGGVESTATLGAGQAFWYYHNGADITDWTYDNN